MEPKEIFSKKIVRLLISIFAVFAILAGIYFQRLPDGRLHLVFCNVGQGDAIIIITPTGEQVLVDGGPDSSVLSCLGEHLPFYDKKLELMVLTHPQADHMVGLISVFENFKVEKILRTNAKNSTAEFEAFTKALKREETGEFEANSNNQISLGQVKGRILWPPENLSFIAQNLNDTSMVLELNFGRFCALLTGDATNNVWVKLISEGKLASCFLVEIAHHGSKNATNDLQLNTISPKIAVISAGKGNRYGHPNEEVVKKLQERKIKILRTDEQGSVEIITNGGNVQIR